MIKANVRCKVNESLVYFDFLIAYIHLIWTIAYKWGKKS